MSTGEEKMFVDVQHTSSIKILRRLNLANLLGLLVAGLGPFHAPANLVERVEKGGLKFGYYGTIISQGALVEGGSGAKPTPITFEFWMHCGLIDDSNTFLAFYDPSKGISVSFHQYGRALAVQRWRQGDAQNPASRRAVYQTDVFLPDKASFVTVASDGSTIDISVDGELVRSASGVGFNRGDIEGRQVVFDAPRSTSSWSGLFRGIAIYESLLTTSAVGRHHSSWTQTGKPELVPEDRAIGLFLFNESSGNLLKNGVNGAADLYIPEKYMVMDQVMLQWSKPGLHLSQDIVLNVAGFIPFGILVFSLLLKSGWRKAAVVTILMGFALSLMIEALQSRLPTRHSTWTDVATNTIGSAAGVLCYRYYRLVRWLLHDAWRRWVPGNPCDTQSSPGGER